jgi:endonuclease/exonuclease/phosphatase family metal-dependent hydrolase
VFVDLEIEGRDEPLTFICTHLDHRPNESERLASADAIRQEVNSMASRPMILAGDLNATPESAVLSSFRKDWMISNDEPLPTIPVDKPTRQIDFVLVRPAQRWEVIETRVLDEAIASDHRAIFSVLELHSPD